MYWGPSLAANQIYGLPEGATEVNGAALFEEKKCTSDNANQDLTAFFVDVSDCQSGNLAFFFFFLISPSQQA